MSDQAQITRIMNKLTKLWRLHPDNRLGDIIELGTYATTNDQLEEFLNLELAEEGHPE